MPKTAHVDDQKVAEQVTCLEDLNPVASAQKGKQKKQQLNALIYAYMQILRAVNVSLNSTQTSAKELNACADQMSAANNVANSINYAQVDQNGDVAGNCDIVLFCGQIQNIVTPGGRVLDASRLPPGYGPSDVMKNQLVQEGMNGMLQVYNVPNMHWRASAQDFDKIQEEDQQIEKVRDFFSNKIIIFQQAGQVQQTNIGSKNDFMSQFIQQDTNIATIMSTLSSQIAQMLRSP